jgi:hypothetical protein
MLHVFLTKCWISLKSAQGCAALLLLLLTLFVNGCASLQTALLAPQTYHFRKVRWGSTKESVLLAEREKRVHFHQGNTVVFKHRHNDVPVLLIYCFHDNHRLRAAGYLTEDPVTLNDPDQLFREELLETLGEPTETFKDGGMVWQSDETVTYTNTYLTGTSDITSFRNVFSRGNTTGNRLKTWRGVCAYIDTNFYRKLKAEGPSLATLGELSYYEESMFGLFRETRSQFIKEQRMPSVP